MGRKEGKKGEGGRKALRENKKINRQGTRKQKGRKGTVRGGAKNEVREEMQKMYQDIQCI